MKNQYFLELPDTIVKYCSDKLFGKSPIIQRMTLVVRCEIQNTDQLDLPVSSKKVFLVCYALITMKSPR